MLMKREDIKPGVRVLVPNRRTHRYGGPAVLVYVENARMDRKVRYKYLLGGWEYSTFERFILKEGWLLEESFNDDELKDAFV